MYLVSFHRISFFNRYCVYQKFVIISISEIILSQFQNGAFDPFSFNLISRKILLVKKFLCFLLIHESISYVFKAICDPKKKKFQAIKRVDYFQTEVFLESENSRSKAEIKPRPSYLYFEIRSFRYKYFYTPFDNFHFIFFSRKNFLESKRKMDETFQSTGILLRSFFHCFTRIEP